MKQLSEKLRDEFDDFDVTPQWFGEVLRDNNLTRKRTRINHQPEKRYNKDINIQDELTKFYAKIKKYPIDKIISVDESSIEPFRTKSYSRCRLGRRCVIKTKDNVVFQKFSLILAVTTEGAQLWQMYVRAVCMRKGLRSSSKRYQRTKKGTLFFLTMHQLIRKLLLKSLSVRQVMNYSILYPINPKQML